MRNFVYKNWWKKSGKWKQDTYYAGRDLCQFDEFFGQTYFCRIFGFSWFWGCELRISIRTNSFFWLTTFTQVQIWRCHVRKKDTNIRFLHFAIFSNILQYYDLPKIKECWHCVLVSMKGINLMDFWA